MKRLAIAAGLVAAAAFPFVFTSPYYLHLVVVIAIFSIVTVGLDIVFGYTGEVSLGHAALVGVGAYTSGVLAFQFGIGFLPSIPVAIIVALAFGALLALPALRVTGPYLAMVTLAFGTIVAILINEMTFLTNGPLGISLKKPLFLDLRDWGDRFPIFDMSLARMRDIEFYYVVAVALVLVLVVINRLLASRFGRAVRQHVRENHTRVPVYSQRLRHQRIDILRHQADGAAMNVAFFAQLRIDFAHDVTGDGKSNAFASARLRINHGVDSRNLPVNIQQRTAAVARIDGRVGLNVKHRLFGLQLARCSAHIPHG